MPSILGSNTLSNVKYEIVLNLIITGLPSILISGRKIIPRSWSVLNLIITGLPSILGKAALSFVKENPF